MTKDRGGIVKVSGLATKGGIQRSKANGSTYGRKKRLNGQKGLPSKTKDIVDVGDGWTYEV